MICPLSLFPSLSPPHFLQVHGVIEVLVLTFLGVDIVLRYMWFRPRQFFTHPRTIMIVSILYNPYPHPEAIIVTVFHIFSPCNIEKLGVAWGGGQHGYTTYAHIHTISNLCTNAIISSLPFSYNNNCYYCRLLCWL